MVDGLLNWFLEISAIVQVLVVSGLIAAGIGVAFGSVRYLKRRQPINPKIDYLPAAKNGHLGLTFDNSDGYGSHAIGKIGEMITALMFVADGWTQLPSQPNGIQKVDGLFIRRRKRNHSYEVAFVETKATTQTSDPVPLFNNDQMTHEKLKQDLLSYKDGAPPHMPDDVVDALVKGLENNSVHISKYLYTHIFPEAETRIYELDRDGIKSNKKPKLIRGPSHRSLFQVLAIGLQRLNPWQKSIKKGGVAMTVNPQQVGMG